MYNSISNYIIEWRISRGKMTYDEYDDLDLKIKGYSAIILTCLFFLICGLFLKCIIQILVILCSFNILKTFSFGCHFSSLERCSLLSTIYLILLSEISKYITNYKLYTFFICIVLFIFTLRSVPNIPDEDKTKPDKFYRLVYIILFILFFIINVICIYIHNNITSLISNSISFGIISVELFLTKTGYKVFRLIDGIKFTKIQKGEIEND